MVGPCCHALAGSGHKAIIKLLLDTDKVDANSKDKYSWTSLSHGAWKGREAVVKLLVECSNIEATREKRVVGRRCHMQWHEAVVKLLQYSLAM